MSAIIGGIIAGGVALIMGITSAISSNSQKKKEEQKERRARLKLEALERSRQAVINQSGVIRDLKKQVYNPMANLAVATQASDLKIEQTDQALANTLDQINQSSSGAGAATAMARMAAASKAQVGASLENQEVQNNQLRMQGEAKAESRKMQLEQAALNAEVSAWDKQESRDLASLDRLAGLQENAQAQAMAYQQQTTAALMGAAEGAASIGTSMIGQKSKGVEGFEKTVNFGDNKENLQLNLDVLNAGQGFW